MLHGLELEKAHKTILTNNLTENTKNEAIRHTDRRNIAKSELVHADNRAELLDSDRL